MPQQFEQGIRMFRASHLANDSCNSWFELLLLDI